jgi:hypothetical protein
MFTPLGKPFSTVLIAPTITKPENFPAIGFMMQNYSGLATKILVVPNVIRRIVWFRGKHTTASEEYSNVGAGDSSWTARPSESTFRLCDLEYSVSVLNKNIGRIEATVT